MKFLTSERAERLYEMYTFILEFWAENKIPPTFRHMAKAVTLGSHAVAQSLVRELVDIGCLAKEGKNTRTKYFPTNVPLPRDVILKLPHVQVDGIISAGSATTTFEATQDKLVPVMKKKIQKGDFALQVRGRSMTGIIENNDTVLIRKWTDSINLLVGKIVVARIDSSFITLKTLREEGDYVVLEANNPDFEDQKFPKESVEIIGYYVCKVGFEKYLVEIYGDRISRIDSRIKEIHKEIQELDDVKNLPSRLRISPINGKDRNATTYYKIFEITEDNKRKYFEYISMEGSSQYLEGVEKVEKRNKLTLLEEEIKHLREQREEFQKHLFDLEKILC